MKRKPKPQPDQPKSENARRIEEQAKKAKQDNEQVLFPILEHLQQIHGSPNWCGEMTRRVELVVSANERKIVLDKSQIDGIYKSLDSEASVQGQIPFAEREVCLKTARKSLDRLDKTKTNPLRRPPQT